MVIAEVMTDFQATALVIGLIIIFVVPIQLWIWKSGNSPEKSKAAAERFRQRQRQPYWEAFQRAYGREAPASLKQLFENTELFTTNRDTFDVELIAESGRKKLWFVSWLNRLTKNVLKKSAGREPRGSIRSPTMVLEINI